MQSYFGFFDPVIVGVQWYDDTSSEAMTLMCELLVQITSLYLPIKNDILPIFVGAALWINFSNFGFS